MTRRKPAALGLTALLALTMLSGCVPTPSHTSTPTPKVTPLFATDDEALAAATKAYAAYLKMSDTIAHDGGARPERIKEFVTTKQLAIQSKDLEAFRKKGNISRGSTKFDSPKLQRVSSSGGITDIRIYVCIDVSGVRLFDSAGIDTTPASRPDRLPLEVQFASSSSDSSTLLIDESVVWSGENFC